MHKYPLALTSLLCSGALLLSSCSSSASKTRYPVAHASVAHRMEKGRVVSVRDVVIDGQSTNMGMVLGGGVGAAVGAVAVPRTSTVKIHDDGRITQSSNAGQNAVAMAVGTVVGAVAAKHIEKALTTKRAQELIIQLESGETVVVVQEAREPAFHAEESVQVYTTGMGNSRVFHNGEDPFVDPDTNAYLLGDEESPEEAFEPVTW